MSCLGDLERGRGDLWQGNLAGHVRVWIWRAPTARHFSGSAWRVCLAGLFGGSSWLIYFVGFKSKEKRMLLNIEKK
jgi:hypothetical protein